MTNARPRRRGFSLIEILIVIALLALLAAIGVGAYFRVQAGAEVQATEGTLNKLNVGIMAKWKAVVDRCVRDVNSTTVPTSATPLPVDVFTFAGNDKERARVLWTYLRLKNEFPTSRGEATTDIDLDGAGLQPPVLRHRTIFDSIQTATPEEESAACLYASLVKGGFGGASFDADPLRNQTKVTAAGNTIFVDTWGKPIVFARMAFAAELDNPPYTPPSGVVSKDPIDPKGKLAGWGSLPSFWGIVTAGHYNYSGFQTTYPMPSRNWIATPVSGGPNEEFGMLFGGDDSGNDNLIGFRLRKEGQRGD